MKIKFYNKNRCNFGQIKNYYDFPCERGSLIHSPKEWWNWSSCHAGTVCFENFIEYLVSK